MNRTVSVFSLALIVLMSSGCGGRPPGVASAPMAFESVDAYITSQMRELGIPGAALVIVQGDRIVHVRGFGVADAEGRPVTEQSPFFTGSTGKSLTALAIMQLVEAGRIRLDAPVQTYLPWFRVADLDASKRITVRQLLTMTSGLSVRTGREPLTNADPGDAAIENNVRALAQAELIAPPGERYEYSNANYITLGTIIQAVTGQSYETYLQEHIFRPLDMQHSFTSKTAAQQAGLVVGFQQWFGVPVASPDLPFARGALPAGGLTMSAEDFGHYLIAQLNDGSYHGISILSPAGLAELHRPAARMGGMAHEYAMGWEVHAYQGVQILSHDGAIPGFTTGMFLVPEENLAIAVMMNTHSPMLGNRVAAVPGNVVRLLLGQALVPIGEFPAMQIAYVLVMSTPLLQGLAIARALRRIHGWRSRAVRLTDAEVARFLTWSIAWNTTIACVLLILLPMAFGASLATMLLFQPDAGWAAVIAGSAAILWGAGSTGVVAWMRRIPTKAIDRGFWAVTRRT